MNPREGQFALGQSLDGWARLNGELSTRQQRLLRRSYRGLELRTYSRYGVRRWTAPLPWTRIIVKDPFALLSLPTIARVTGAIPVIVFRHPAAVLASYRRMGWRADVAEVRRLRLPSNVAPPTSADLTDDADAMACFWRACYATVLNDLATLPQAVVVDHAELARGGREAVRSLYKVCGLEWRDPLSAATASGRREDARTQASTHLHNFARSPARVADGWRDAVERGEITRLDAATCDILQDLSSRRTPL